MKPSHTRKKLTTTHFVFAIVAGIFLLAILGAILWFSRTSTDTRGSYLYVRTVAGLQGEFGEPFGIAVKGSDIYASDGQHGKIWRINNGPPVVFADGLDTPSALAFDPDSNLIVADAGSHTIKSITPTGETQLVAGVEARPGFAEGDAAVALFNAPIGVAVAGGRIYVADTYNDRIRVIENNEVRTLAGGEKGYGDGLGENAKFDTPSGIAVWQDKLLVADTGNRRIRVVESDGRVWTLAGNGESDLVDGSPLSASFAGPMGIAVEKTGAVYVTDGNAIRTIGGGAFPLVTTISSRYRGLRDGIKSRAQFNRTSGIGFDANGNLLVADSENRLVRVFSPESAGHEISVEEIGALRDKPADFRVLQPSRWPFDPANTKRDIAGTLGEIRGEIKDTGDQAWFHNGLDIAGAYGETARFIREEKVLRPSAAENFGTLRELIRMPTLGYIHIRLGRDVNSEPFGDARFQFERAKTGKLTGVRVPRGAKFKAGEPIGTLNPMNHVHLVAGRSGSEMNALDALILPGIADSRPPLIEKVTFYDQNWKSAETVSQNSRIKLTAKTRVVVRSYDQMDGNSERRRLGVYKLGYQMLNSDKTPLADTAWTLHFDRMPSNDAVRLAYANGSHSGATGETIFNYVVTNVLDGDEFREDFIDPATLEPGSYVFRVSAADYFGNTSSKDIDIEVVK